MKYKGVDVKVTGINKTIDHMLKFSNDFFDTAKDIAKNAANIVENVGKQQAPMGKTGRLRKSIKKKSVSSTQPSYTVFPRTKRGGGHRHLVAYGTKQRATKTGKSTGVMPKNDFMQGAEAAAEPYFKASIEAEVRRDKYI